MLFTPGPTEMSDEIRRIGAEPLSYFRSPEYCQQILGLTENLKYLLGTQSTPLTVTASGTAGMEMAIVNLFEPGDRVVSINAGTFGAKWGQMGKALGLDLHELQVPHGRNPDLGLIGDAVTPDTKGLLLTAHETSTGYLFDIQAIVASLRNEHCLTVVDGVSSIGADEFAMESWGCDCAIACSQKALACMPGLVFVAFSDRAREVVDRIRRPRSYLDARTYFENIPRGMLPFTPAMHATMQVAAALEAIRSTGLDEHLSRIRAKANAFRDSICRDGEFKVFPQRSSNALSAISLPAGIQATQLVARIKEHHGAILPLNPTRAEDFVRVSHMGALDGTSLQRLADWLHAEVASMRRVSA